MNPALDDSEHIEVSIYTSEGVKYGSKAVVTSEMVEAMGTKQVGSEGLRILLDILDEAYDEEFYWENGNIETRQPERVWEKVKNINTDEELEEIKHLLGIRDEE